MTSLEVALPSTSFFEFSTVTSVLLASLIVIIVTTGLVWLLSHFQERTILPHPVLSRGIPIGHHWTVGTALSGHPAYCNVCGEGPLLSSSAFCECCGIWADEACIKEANINFKCKEQTKEQLPKKLSSTNWLSHRTFESVSEVGEGNISHTLNHNWKKGNLSLTAKCSICHDACGQQPGLSDWRCVWCGRSIHDDCIAQANQICDLGPFSHYIIPPYLICLKQLGMRSYRKTVIAKSPSACQQLSSLSSPTDSNNDVPPCINPRLPYWTPLIVIANCKSGGSDANAIMAQFRAILNPVQVVDLSTSSPLDGLRWCLLFPDVQFRILICGGDGTIGWVLRTADSLELPIKPQYSILPLGTGNDLSRVLGWGGGFTADELDVKNFLKERLDPARPVNFDRWRVHIRNDRKFGLRRSKEIVMNNYFSIGCDALVTLNFHRKREQIPKAVSSRLLNKLLFFVYGTKDTFIPECRKLNEKVKLELDGQEMELPELESIVVLNINSWGAGVPVWSIGSLGQDEESRYDDGVLEVFGVYSSFHIAQLQVHLTEPYRIGQAKHVRITTRAPFPVQCDGEPWTQIASIIDVTYFNQVVMLKSLPPDEDQKLRHEPLDSSSEEDDIIFC